MNFVGILEQWNVGMMELWERFKFSDQDRVRQGVKNMKQRVVFGIFLVMLGIRVWGAPSGIQINANIPTDDPIPGNRVVVLSLSGKDLKEIKGMRCVVEKAIDDQGKNLLVKESDLTKTNQDWTPVVVDPKIPPGMQLLLDLPSPRASCVKELTGRLEILTPVHDPLCLLKFSNLAAQLDQELSDPNLTAAQIKIKVTTPKKSRKPCVEVRVQDPLAKLFYFEIVDAKNKEWEVNSSITTIGTSRTYTYEGTLPEGASLRVCVPKPKSIMVVPLNIKNMVLPQKKSNN